MKQFKYSALTLEGEMVQNQTIAQSKPALQEQLLSQNLFLVEAKEIRGLKSHWHKYRMTDERLALYLKEMAFLLQSGLPLYQVLELLVREQMPMEVSISTELKDGLAQGESFSGLWRRLTLKQAEIVAEWIEVGERQGHLSQALSSVSKQLIEMHRLKQRLLQELLYPALVLLLLIFVGALFALVLMPTLAETYLRLDLALPFYMKPALYLGQLIKSYPLMTVILLLGILFLFGYRTKENRLFHWRRWRLLRQTVEWQLYVMFARSLAGLLKSGISLSEGMGLLTRQKRFRWIQEELIGVEEALLHGASVSQAFSDAVFIPTAARVMIASGEESGRLDLVLEESATYYDLLLERRMKILVKVIEPLAILFLGALVLLLALSFFIPLFQSYQSFLH